MSFDSGQSPAPYRPPGQFDTYAQPPRSSAAPWLLVIGGGVVVLSLILCCGGGFFVMKFGVDIMASEIKNELRDNPKIREHLGELESVEMDFTASAAAEGDDTYYYKARGSKGSGELTIEQHTDDDGDEVIDSAILRLPNGEKVQIVP